MAGCNGYSHMKTLKRKEWKSIFRYDSALERKKKTERLNEVHWGESTYFRYPSLTYTLESKV